MEITTTTKKHFEFFKKKFKKWCNFWKISGWEIVFKHEDIEETKNNRAFIKYGCENRIVIVVLAKDWSPDLVNNKELELTAFHEATELFLARFNSLATERFVQFREFEEENHHIIRTLEEVIFEKEK